MKEELNQTIDELNEVIKEKKLNILDKDLLDFALKLYITESINKQKQFYPKTYPKNEFNIKKDFPFIKKDYANPLTKSEEPATEKQINLIKRYGKVIPAGLTKRKAMKIISNLKENE
jgi:hypothetical protein